MSLIAFVMMESRMLYAPILYPTVHVLHVNYIEINL